MYQQIYDINDESRKYIAKCTGVMALHGSLLDDILYRITVLLAQHS